MTNDSDALSGNPQFDLAFDQQAGDCVTISPLVRRMVAGNGGPFTFTGTCSYIVGRGQVAIIDPGPEDERHLTALADAVRGETVTHILVTHTHRDHSPGARRLSNLTGAPIIGCAPHSMARQLAFGEINTLDSSVDHAHDPQHVMEEGDAVSGLGWTLSALATPGHTANHLAFALHEENTLFSGDHVMAWSTSIVGPPDGSMADYMRSLDKLKEREERLYWPGHGGPVKEPQRFVRALHHHRRQREASILNRLRQGDRDIPAITRAIYDWVKPALLGAAALSVFAHLEDLVEQGLVITDGPPQLDGDYRLS